MIENLLSEWQQQIDSYEWWMVVLCYAFCIGVDWLLNAKREKAAKEEEYIQHLYSGGISYLVLCAIISTYKSTWPSFEARKAYLDKLHLAYRDKKPVLW
nr:hypothetical protein [uncultured Vibrio sp.]